MLIIIIIFGLILLFKNWNKGLSVNIIIIIGTRLLDIGLAHPQTLKPFDVIVVQLNFDDKLLRVLVVNLLILHYYGK